MITRPWRPRAILLALLTLSMLALSPIVAAQTPVSATEGGTAATITVYGTGVVNLDPDTAQIELGVFASDESLEAAQATVNDGITAVANALLDSGVLANDITTSSYNVYPVTSYDDNGNYIGVSRYEVSSGLNVIVRDIASVGAILDLAVGAGANNIWGIYFSVDDPSVAAGQARELAMSDARARADELAALVDATVTRAVSITEISAPTPGSTPYYGASGLGGDGRDQMASMVPVNPGQAEVVVIVQVVYEITPI